MDDAGLSKGDYDGVSTDAIIWSDCDVVVPTMTEGGDTKIVGLFVIGKGISKIFSSSNAVGKVMDTPTVVRAVLFIFGMTNCNVGMAVICILHFFPQPNI